jgi:predicted phage-related endonuclease
MLASPDRFAVLKDRLEDAHPFSGRIGLELKTSRSLEEWGEDGAEATGHEAASIIPPYYATQVLWYMAVCGLPRWDVAVFLLPADEFRRYIIRRDPAAEKQLVEKCRAWWQWHIVEGEPPELDGSPAAASWLQSRYPEPRDSIREATDEETALIERLRQAEAEAKRWAEEATRLKLQVEEKIGHHEGLIGSFGRINWKTQRGRSRIDTKRLRADHPHIAAAYTITGDPIRVLRKSWRLK